MIITKLEQRDIPGCREIYNYYVKNTSFSLEETELTADQYEARVAGVTERFPFLVARDDAGNVVGFAYLSDFNPRSGYRHTADLSIYTAPDLRGVGLGRRCWRPLRRKDAKWESPILSPLLPMKTRLPAGFTRRTAL